MWRSKVAACIAVTGVAAAAPAWGAAAVTSYADGAVVEVDVPAKNGYCEVRLPSGVKESSLRVKSLGQGGVERVEVVADEKDGAAAGRLGALEERKSRIEDRIRALDTKEEIFRAAAKSQSGKAPRKTKANPEPIESIRKGTEYAIAQLEEVYRARRKADTDLKNVEQQILALKQAGKRHAQTARIWLREKSGRARAAYFLPALGWQPAYDLRLSSRSEASVVLRAILPPVEKDAVLSVAGPDGRILRVPRGERFPVVASYAVPAVVRHADTTPRGGLDVTLTNATTSSFSAGPVSCFLDGVFIGKVSLPATPPGGTATLSVLP